MTKQFIAIPGCRFEMRIRTIALLLMGASLFTVGCRRAAETDDAAAIARRWIELYNDGTPTSYGSDRFLELYAENCVWAESPTKSFPAGRKGSLEQIRKELADAQSVLVDRHVVLYEVVASGPIAAMRYSWSAKVNGDIAGHPKGSRMAFEVAAFFKVRHGRIADIRELLAELP